MRAVIGLYQREASVQTAIPTPHQAAPTPAGRSPNMGAPSGPAHTLGTGTD